MFRSPPPPASMSSKEDKDSVGNVMSGRDLLQLVKRVESCLVGEKDEDAVKDLSRLLQELRRWTTSVSMRGGGRIAWQKQTQLEEAFHKEMQEVGKPQTKKRRRRGASGGGRRAENEEGGEGGRESEQRAPTDESLLVSALSRILQKSFIFQWDTVGRVLTLLRCIYSSCHSMEYMLLWEPATLQLLSHVVLVWTEVLQEFRQKDKNSCTQLLQLGRSCHIVMTLLLRRFFANQTPSATRAILASRKWTDLLNQIAQSTLPSLLDSQDDDNATKTLATCHHSSWVSSLSTLLAHVLPLVDHETFRADGNNNSNNSSSKDDGMPPAKRWTRLLQNLATSLAALIQTAVASSANTKRKYTIPIPQQDDETCGILTVRYQQEVWLPRVTSRQLAMADNKHEDPMQVVSEQRQQAFQRRCQGLGHLLVAVLQHPPPNTTTTLDLSILLFPNDSSHMDACCPLLLSFASLAETHYLSTKAPLRHETTNHVLSAAAAVQVALQVKSLGHDVFDAILTCLTASLSNQSAPHLVGNRLLQLALASLQSSVSTQVRRVILEQSSLAGLQQQKQQSHCRRWLADSIASRTRAVVSMRKVLVVLGTASIAFTSMMDKIILLILATLLEQPQDASQNEDAWGSVRERQDLQLACIEAATCIVSTTGCLLPIATRWTLDNVVAEFLITVTFSTPDNIQAALLSWATAAVQTPWSDGATTLPQLASRLQQVAHMAQSGGGVAAAPSSSVWMAASMALSALQMLATPRVAPLSIVPLRRYLPDAGATKSPIALLDRISQEQEEEEATNGLKATLPDQKSTSEPNSTDRDKQQDESHSKKKSSPQKKRKKKEEESTMDDQAKPTTTDHTDESEREKRPKLADGDNNQRSPKSDNGKVDSKAVPQIAAVVNTDKDQEETKETTKDLEAEKKTKAVETTQDVLPEQTKQETKETKDVEAEKKTKAVETTQGVSPENKHEAQIEKESPENDRSPEKNKDAKNNHDAPENNIEAKTEDESAESGKSDKMVEGEAQEKSTAALTDQPGNTDKAEGSKEEESRTSAGIPATVGSSSRESGEAVPCSETEPKQSNCRIDAAQNAGHASDENKSGVEKKDNDDDDDSMPDIVDAPPDEEE